MLNLPSCNHTWILGPLLDKFDLRYQFKSRTIRLVHCMTHSSNDMVM